MMNIRSRMARLRLLAVMAAVVCLLAGCSMFGVSVDTQLKVNEDLSGVRVMDVTIPANMVSGRSPVSIDTLNQLIEESCPPELAWSYVKNGNSDQYHVELSFDSLVDYIAKVKVLTGRTAVQLEMEASDSVWAKGIRVKEDFTSADLLAWLKDALVSKGLVTSDAADRIFRAGFTELVYGDRSYKTDFMIQVDEIVKTPLEKVDVLTNVKSMDRFDRSFVIYVPQPSMEANGGELRAYLEGMVPADAAFEWGLYGNGATLTVRKEDLSLSGLNAFSQAMLAAEDAGGGVSLSEEDSGADVFSFTDRWKEEMNLAAYGSDESGTVYAGYYVKAENGIEVSGATELAAEQASEMGSAYDGYQLVCAERTASLTASFELARAYRVGHTDIRTVIKDGNLLEREMKLTLQETPEETHREQIVNRLRERSMAAADAGDRESADKAADAGTEVKEEPNGAENSTGETGQIGDVNTCEIRAEAGEDGFAVVISMKGEAVGITEMSGRILGGTTEIFWVREGGPFSLRKKFSYAETADYSEFLAAAAEDHVITYVMEFDGAGGSLTEPDEAALKALEDQGITRSVSGKTVTLMIKGTAYHVEESGSAMNVPGIILWVVAVLLIVIAVAVAVRCGAARKVKEKADIRQIQEKMDEKELRRASEAAEQAEARAREAAMQLTGQKMEVPLLEEPQADTATEQGNEDEAEEQGGMKDPEETESQQ